MKIGITGSLASGKSSVTKILSKDKKLIFSADKEVKNLYLNKKFKIKLKKKLKIQGTNIKEEIISKLTKKFLLLIKFSEKNFNFFSFFILLS